MKEQIRYCHTCHKNFVHTPVMYEGRDILDDVHHCEECTCGLQEMREKAYQIERATKMWESCVAPEYRYTDLKHSLFPYVRYVAAKKSLDRSTFLGLTGEGRCCKTRVAAMIIKNLIWTGLQVHWVNCISLQSMIQMGRDHLAAEMHICKNRDVILLDDIGAMSGTKATCSVIYEILEERSSKRKKTIWTSKESPESILKGTSSEKDRQRCIDRLIDYSTIINLSDEV